MRIHNTFAIGQVVSKKLALTGEPIIVAGDDPESETAEGHKPGRWYILTPLDIEGGDIAQIYAELEQHDPTSLLCFEAE